MQVVIVPISKNDEDKNAINIFEPYYKIIKNLRGKDSCRWTNNTPGYKFNEWEMKGVPLRMEVRPRDIENDKVVLVRRI